VKWVYMLQSLSFPLQHYTGLADNLETRLADHNSGRARHTSKYKPWKIVVAVRFESDSRAISFERYLKSGSGQSFSRRHFW
jgi:predicted GIY-YIG superfamily endonuclease